MKHRFPFLFLLLTSHSIMLSAAWAVEDWYPFQPKNHHTAPGAISMADWSAEAAGKFGRITRQSEKLFYKNKEIQLWGTCLGYSDSKPQKERGSSLAHGEPATVAVSVPGRDVGGCARESGGV